MRCIRCEYDNFQQSSITYQATSILSYRSRFLPRVSPRALTLIQLDTLALVILGGVGGLRMLHGHNRTSAKNVRVSSDKQEKIVKGTYISTHTTDDTVSFRVQPTDAHSRRLVPDDKTARFRGLGSEKGGWARSALLVGQLTLVAMSA